MAFDTNEPTEQNCWDEVNRHLRKAETAVEALFRFLTADGLTPVEAICRIPEHMQPLALDCYRRAYDAQTPRTDPRPGELKGDGPES